MGAQDESRETEDRIDLIRKTHGLGHDCAEAVGRVKDMLSLIEEPHRLRLIE